MCAGTLLAVRFIFDICFSLGGIFSVAIHAFPYRDHEVFQVALFIGLSRCKVLRHFYIAHFTVDSILDGFGSVVKDVPAHSAAFYDSRTVDIFADYDEVCVGI